MTFFVTMDSLPPRQRGPILSLCHSPSVATPMMPLSSGSGSLKWKSGFPLPTPLH
jgi:hypothetical protein